MWQQKPADFSWLYTPLTRVMKNGNVADLLVYPAYGGRRCYFSLIFHTCYCMWDVYSIHLCEISASVCQCLYIMRLSIQERCVPFTLVYINVWLDGASIVMDCIYLSIRLHGLLYFRHADKIISEWGGSVVTIFLCCRSIKTTEPAFAEWISLLIFGQPLFIHLAYVLI